MKSINTYILERLVLSKNKRSITAEDFYRALKSYKGEYKFGNINGTFSLEKYCKDNNIDPGFNCLDANENDFYAHAIMIIRIRDNELIKVFGKDQANHNDSRVFNDFDDFIQEVLNRNGEHLQNIYNILIGK